MDLDDVLMSKNNLSTFSIKELHSLARYYGLEINNDLCWLLALIILEDGTKSTSKTMPTVQKYTFLRDSSLNRIKLGSGSLGKVYLGEDDTGKSVAMKEIPLRISGKADNEIFIGKYIGCKHKNVACMLDVIERQGVLIIVTEYVGKLTLDKIIHTISGNTLLILDICHQIADGLEYMHDLKVAHRDIKPANIVMKDMIPVIIDFDFACISGDAEHDCIGRKGTPTYLPPEVWKNVKGRDPFAGDIYSLGVVFYYMFNGIEPFPIGKNMDIWDIKDLVIETEPLASDTEIPTLDDLIMSMMNKNQEDRPKINHIKNVLADLIKSQ